MGKIFDTILSTDNLSILDKILKAYFKKIQEREVFSGQKQ